MQTMTCEEFRERVDAILVGRDLAEQRWDGKPLPSDRGPYRSAGARAEAFDGLLVQWETGGMSGGNCWEDSDPQPYRTDARPVALTALDAVLEEIAPELTYVAWRRLATLVLEGDYEDRGYYGNRTDYRYRAIPLEGLHRFLVAEGLVAEPVGPCASP
jgi:hypothetical protein